MLFFANSKISARISNIEFDYFAWNFSIFKRWKFRKLSSQLKWPTCAYFFSKKKWPTIALNDPLVNFCQTNKSSLSNFKCWPNDSQFKWTCNFFQPWIRLLNFPKSAAILTKIGPALLVFLMTSVFSSPTNLAPECSHKVKMLSNWTEFDPSSSAKVILGGPMVFGTGCDFLQELKLN